MEIAVLSDIHSNYLALEKCLPSSMEQKMSGAKNISSWIMKGRTC
ncbi:putative phosphodiesterase [Anaerotaenia torta]